MQFACRCIAFSTHNGYFFAVASHINHYQSMSHSFQLASWIDEHIAGLHITYLSWFRLTAHRKSAAHSVGFLQEFLQRFARSPTLILKRIAIYVLETYLRAGPLLNRYSALTLMVISAHCSELLSIGMSITPVERN